MTLATINWPAWALAIAGGACAVISAKLASGDAAAWGAAGTALMGMAGVLGWAGKSPTTPTK